MAQEETTARIGIYTSVPKHTYERLLTAVEALQKKSVAGQITKSAVIAVALEQWLEQKGY